MTPVSWQRVEDGYRAVGVDALVHDNGAGVGPSRGSGRWAVVVAGSWCENVDTLAEAKLVALAYAAEERIQPAATQDERESWQRLAAHYWTLAAARPHGRAGGSRPAPRSAAPVIDSQGGNVSTTTTESPAVEPKASAPKVAEGVTVEALVAALREAGVKPKVRWNPKRTYASLLVGGKNIGYVSKPNRNGMKVEPALAHGDLKNAVKKAFAPQEKKGAFGAVAMVVDEKGLAHAVAALVVADERRRAAKEGS